MQGSAEEGTATHDSADLAEDSGEDPGFRSSPPRGETGHDAAVVPQSRLDMGSSTTRRGSSSTDTRSRRRGRRTRSADPRPGERIDRFVVTQPLGRGAMGVVMAAYDEQLDRKVALKLLPAGVHGRRRERLRREARALAQLSHPNVVEVFDVGEVGPRVFLAMELVQGQTLRTWRRKGPHAWPECVRVYLQAARGLAAAHAQGLVHRDFKPDNCILGEDGRVRVLDFGLVLDAGEPTGATSPSGEEPSADELEPLSDRPALTRTGAVLGTPAYMAPEQLRGQPADPRSDQYGFCVALHEAITDHRPFEGESIEDLHRAHRRPPPADKALPPRLRRVLHRGLAPDPDDRWPGMDALIDAIERVTRPRRARLAAGAAGLVALAGTAGMLAWGYGAGSASECGDSATYRAEVWNEDHAQRVHRAIENTGLAYAPDTWARVEAGLDDYAQRWALSRVTACTATHGQGSQEGLDQRIACLAERRLALAQVVQVLAETNPTTMDGAVGLVTGLPALASCDDPQALARGLPPPADPAVARRLPALRQRLARARILAEAAHYDAAAREAEAAFTMAESLGHPPSLTQAHLVRGIARAASGDPTGAEPDLEQAYDDAVAQGNDPMAGEAAARLATVLGEQLSRPEPAVTWAKTALSIAQRSGEDTLAEAQARQQLGLLYAGLAQLDEAQAMLERAAQIHAVHLPPEHPQMATMAVARGRLHVERGELPAAVEAFERALEIRTQALGPQHPDHAEARAELGQALHQMGRLPEAIEHLEASLAVYRAAYGPQRPEVADATNRLAIAIQDQGDLTGAITLLEDAATIYERSDLDEPVGLATILSNLSIMVRLRGDIDRACTVARRAMEAYERAYGPEHPLVAKAAGNLSLSLLAAGKPEPAIEALERATAIFEAHELDADVMQAHMVMGRIYVQQGRFDDAVAKTRAARALAQAEAPGEHPGLFLPLIEEAEVELVRGQPTAAIPLLERALKLEVPPQNRARATFSLARALWDEGRDRTRAMKLAHESVEALAAYGSAAEIEVKQAREWIAERSG